MRRLSSRPWIQWALAVCVCLRAPSGASAQGVFQRGDCDQSLKIDITDAIFELSFLFLGGRAPVCEDSCDTDDNGALEITDAIALLNFLFLGGPSPRVPYPLEGVDTTPDERSCANGKDPPADLRIGPPRLRFRSLEARQALVVVAVDSSGNEEDVRLALSTVYTSSEPAVAEVGADGVVTSRGVGSAVITIYYRGTTRQVPVDVLPSAGGAPDVRITSPTPDSVTTAASVLFAGYVTDPQAEVSFGGAPIDSPGGFFAREVPLEIGLNTLTVTAVRAGAAASASVGVSRAQPGSPGAAGPDGKPLPRLPEPRTTPGDTTPPVLAITSPPAGATLLTGAVAVQGTVDDPGATLLVNGVPARIVDGQFQGLAQLPPGPGTITVEATDAVGNRATATRSITVDATLPRIAITAPGLVVAGVKPAVVVNVRGTVQPAGAPVQVNGLDARVSGTSWNVDLPLPPGEHTLTATASIAGPLPRRAQILRSLHIDAEGPVVAVAHPPEVLLLSATGYRASSAAQRFSGRVADVGPSRDLEGALALTVGGVSATILNGTFAADLVLGGGTTTVEVRATDARGNVTARTFKVTRGGTPLPTLSALAGDGAALQAGQAAPVALVVEARDSAGALQRNVPVEFRVIQGDGRLDGGVSVRTVTTGSDGRASAAFTAGKEVGFGVVQVSAPGQTTSPIAMTLRVSPSVVRVLAARGPRRARALAGEDLRSPLGVRLLDAGGAGIEGQPIVFRVLSGGARFGGASQITASTGPTGAASAVPRLPAGAASLSLVEASIADLEAVRFELEGIPAGPVAETSLDGVVLDRFGQPLPEARVDLALGSGTISTVTDTRGLYHLPGVPWGEFLLTATKDGHLPARCQALCLPGAREQAATLRLLPAEGPQGERSRSVALRDGRSAALTLPGLPGLRLEIAPGAATFADGSHAGTLTLAALPLSSLATEPLDDASVEIPLLVLPFDVRFDPPARLVLPSVRDLQGRKVPLSLLGAGGYAERSVGVVEDAAGGIVFGGAAGLRSGGLLHAAQPGPLLGRTGALAGNVLLPLPGLGEAPARPDSVVLGFNVLVHSGELFLEVTDLELPAPGRSLSYAFRRRYESRHGFQGSLGWGWEHEYEDRRLFTFPGSGNVVRATGRGGFDEYPRDELSGRFVSPPGVFNRLFVDGDGFFVEREPGGLRYRYFPLDGTARAGRLASVTSRQGDRLTCHRGEGGLLVAVEDPLGRRVTYFHDGSGRITSIQDETGREVVFTFDGEGDLTRARGPIVEDTPTDNEFPEGRISLYEYAAGRDDPRLNHNLLRIIDPRESASTRIPRVTITYGEDPVSPSFDRVVREDWGGTNATGVQAGGAYLFEYTSWERSLPTGATAAELESHLLATAGSTRCTDPEGRVTEILWTGAGLPSRRRIFTAADSRPRDPTNLHPPVGILPPHYETRWEWSREGLLLVRVEPRGDRHVFHHDESSPLRIAQGALLRQEHFPVPGDASPPLVTTYRRDPLFGIAVEEVSPRGNGPGGQDAPEAHRRLRFIDYQEGATLEGLAAEIEADVPDLEDALARSGVVLGLGDLNGDGDLSQQAGNVIAEDMPPTPRPGSDEPFVERRLQRFNRFGQLVARIDGAGRVERREYHPESDWNGDGAPDLVEGRDADTGGGLARRLEDHGLPGASREVVVERFRYDRRGFLASRIDALGNEELFAYSPLGELMERRLAPPLKYRFHSIYDLDGNLVRSRTENYTQTDGGGHFLVSENRWIDVDREYDLLGRVVTVDAEVSEGEVGPARRIVTRYRHDSAGRITLILSPVPGTDEARRYEERGLLVETRQGEGTPEVSSVRRIHDEGGLLVREEGDLPGGAREHRFDGFGRKIAELDAAGGARVLELDREGNVVTESHLGSSGGPTPSASQPGGLLLARTCRTFDGQNRKIEERRFDFLPGAGPEAPVRELVERLRFGAGGLLEDREDPVDGLEHREHDAAGRLLRRTFARGDSVAYTLDDDGHVVREVREHLTLSPVAGARAGDPDYDDSGRFREVETVLREVDPLGRLTLLIDTAGGVWRARYDSRGNKILVTDARGTSVAESQPEFAGLLPFMTETQRARLNDQGNRRRYVYDGLNRLVEARHELRIDGEGAAQIDLTSPFNRDGIITEKLEWDDLGRLAAWIDDDERRTEVTRDARGHVVAKRWADGTTATYARALDGRLLEATDPNGSIIHQELDVLGRLSARHISPGPGVEGTRLQRFEYDGLSRLTLAYDGGSPDDPLDDSTVALRRSSLGYVIEESQNGLDLSFERDVAGRILSVRYPDGWVLETPRDARGQVLRVEDALGVHVTRVNFGSGLPLERRARGGAVLSFLAPDGEGVPRKVGYDFHGETLEHVHRTTDGALVQGFEYGRDRSGLKLYEKALHRADNLGEVWRYDSVGRIRLFLPNVFDPRVPPDDPVEKLVFYHDGNHSWRLIEVNFGIRRLEVDARAAYVRSDDDVLTHDARGSLSTAGAIRYAYDAFGRVVRVERNGRTVASYSYDALGAQDPEDLGPRGRRARKLVLIPGRDQPAGLLRFTYLGSKLLEERGEDGRLQRQFLHADGPSPEALLLWDPLGTFRAYSVLRDAAESPTGLLDQNGAVAESYRYDPHGAQRAFNVFGSPLNFSNLGFAVGAGGAFVDHETGLLLRGARHFDPTFGRHLVDDSPLVPGAPLELNGYLYPGFGGVSGEITGNSTATLASPDLSPFRVTIEGGLPGGAP